VSVEDARALAPGALVEADICIVGGGAAGLTLAQQLARSSLSICLLESGGEAVEPDIQSLYDMESSGYPQRQNYMSRARYFGGSCNLWAGRSMRLDPIDFESREWVPDSGWPIRYEEVTGYYPAAAKVLELPGVTPADLDGYRNAMTADEIALFADGTFSPTTPLWARRTQRFSSYLRRLRQAPRIRALLHASLTGFQLNEAGSAVTSARAGTLAGNTFTLRAGRYVLACGGLENARLLLASRDRHPQGVGNAHGLVGRYFMDHPRAVYGRVHVPANVRLSALRGRPLPDGKMQIGIGLSAETQRREKLLNHYVTLESQTSGYAEARYQAMVQTAKVLLRRGHAGSRWDFGRMKFRDLPEMVYLLSPKELLPHWMYRALVACREAIPRKPSPRTYIVVYFCEQPPDARSRATLTNDVDALGVPRLSLHWHIGDEVRDSMRRMQSLLQSRLAATGMGRLDPGGDDFDFTDASHHMGTTRMSVDARQGVVDTDCRVHGVDNLYIAGSSVFPCAGYANPTLTIVALSLRLADHLLAASNSTIRSQA
jgi:choline dehydrogenase-like flavoprotein